MPINPYEPPEGKGGRSNQPQPWLRGRHWLFIVVILYLSAVGVYLRDTGPVVGIFVLGIAIFVLILVLDLCLQHPPRV